MKTDNLDRETARKSAIVYLAITVAAALFFFSVAELMGTYPLVAKIGGAVWVGFLTLIVSMPLVTSAFKKKFKSVK